MLLKSYLKRYSFVYQFGGSPLSRLQKTLFSKEIVPLAKIGPAQFLQKQVFFINVVNG